MRRAENRGGGRRGDRIGFREVPSPPGGRVIIESTSWMSNGFLLTRESGLPAGASLSQVEIARVYDSVIGVIIGAFDGEGYIAFERSRASRAERPR